VAKRVRVKGIPRLRGALAALPKEATKELRDAAQDMSEDIASQAATKARGVSTMYRTYVAPTIKARRDKVPVIKVGGRKRIRKGNERQRVGELLFGAEYGGRGRPTTQQFLPHLGTTGYALWPTVRQEMPNVVDAYADAITDATVKAARRG
jgi:hypothetical protein